MISRSADQPGWVGEEGERSVLSQGQGWKGLQTGSSA